MIKQVIVVRKDLNMRKGKIAAQVAHASLASVLNRMYTIMDPGYIHYHLTLRDNSVLAEWLSGKFTKICVSVNSDEELLEIQNKAIENDIYCTLITDAGNTEFHGVPTNTCLALGPDYSDKIDKITGELKLL